MFLGEAVDLGIDAVIVQDIGLIRLIQTLYPDLEIHGSTQMTVHDGAGAAVVEVELGVDRVVLARENTLDDIRAIRAAVPELGLETFVHGALCISYSGQCFMSGMISERSANRGSCAQSCRKDYVLTDVDDARRARSRLSHLGQGSRRVRPSRRRSPTRASAVSRSKGERRSRSTSRRSRRPIASSSIASSAATRRRADRSRRCSRSCRSTAADSPAACTAAAQGRDYVTRTQPDNRGIELGTVVGYERGELIVDVSPPMQVGDGLGFEPPEQRRRSDHGFSVHAVRTLGTRGTVRQAIETRVRVAAGLARRAHVRGGAARARARELRDAPPSDSARKKPGSTCGCSARAGTPLKAVFVADGETVTVRTEITLAPATKRPLDVAVAARAARPARRDAVRARRARRRTGSAPACSFR